MVTQADIRRRIAIFQILRGRPYPGQRYRHGWIPVAGFVPKGKKKPAREIIEESSDEAMASLRSVVDGTYAGLTVRVVSAKPARGQVDFTATIEDASGAKVGKVRRIVSTDDNGDLVAEHVRLELDPSVRGQGFADEFNGTLEDWYRESGVTRIELEADIDVGGYAWARQGFDWRDGEVPDDVIRRIHRAASGPDESDYFIADYSDPAFRGDPRFGTFQVFREDGDDPIGTFPSRSLAEQARDRDLVGREGDPLAAALLERIEAGEYVSAYEVSQLGRKPGQSGRDAMWPGKAIMLGSDWYGVRWLLERKP